MGRGWLIAVAAAAFAWSGTARGDEIADCVDASSRGQVELSTRDLIAARDSFRVCARKECPHLVQKFCTGWLEQVQASLPSVVPIATDTQGIGLPGTTVTMDGKALPGAGDGRSLEVNPGVHTFAFEAQDGRRAEKTVVVPEGDRELRVAGAMPTQSPVPATSPASPAPAAPVASATTAPAASATVSSASADPAQRSGPWKAAGLIGAGVGVIGLGVGAIFGIEALSDKHDAGCAASGMCVDTTAAAKQADAQRAGNLSTAFFVAGGVLGAAGVAVFALAPRSGVRALASADAHSAGFALRGSW